MSGTLPPLQQLSPDNDGPMVVVVAYILISVTVLFTTIRVITFHTLKRGFGLDDAYLLFAAIVGLAQTVLTQRAVDNGLGRSMDQLDAEQIDSYYKLTYSAQILAIVVMGAAKISVVQLVIRLSQRRSRLHMACHVTGAVVGLWTVFSTLSLALQCQMPGPWIYSPERCAGSGALWYPIVVLNLLTDAVLAFLFAPVLWRLKMSLSQRFTITTLFGTRAIVCILEIVQLAMLAPALSAVDQTGSTAVITTVRQIVMNFSVIAAAIPSLHRFLNDLQTGALGTRITENQYELSQGGSQTFSGRFGRSKPGVSSDESKSHNSQTSGSRLSSRIFSDHATKSANRAARQMEIVEEGHIPEENSTSSLTNNNGVMQTWEISIEVENKEKDKNGGIFQVRESRES